MSGSGILSLRSLLRIYRIETEKDVMMNLRLQIIIAVILLVAFGILVNMIRKRKIELKYALAWLLVDIAVLVLDIFPGIIKGIANAVGIASPMNLLFFAGFCFSLILIFVLTCAVSGMSVQIKNLTQEIALAQKEREERDKQEAQRERQVEN